MSTMRYLLYSVLICVITVIINSFQKYTHITSSNKFYASQKFRFKALLMKSSYVRTSTYNPTVYHRNNALDVDRYRTELNQLIKIENTEDYLRKLHVFVSNQIKSREHLTKYELSIIAQKTMRHLMHMNSRSIAETVWSIGALNKDLKIKHPSFIDLAIKSLQSLQTPVKTQSNELSLNEIALCKLFNGLARLELTVDDIPPHLLIHVLQSNQVSFDHLNSQGVSNLIWSIGKMSIPLSIMPPSCQVLLFKRLVFVNEFINDQGISNILIGLSRMNVNWNQLPVIVRSAISSIICRNCIKFSPQAVANTIYSLGKLQTDYLELTDRLQIALEILIRHVCKQKTKFSRDVTQILTGMVSMKFYWKYLSTSTSELLSNTIYNNALTWRQSFSLQTLKMNYFVDNESDENLNMNQLDYERKISTMLSRNHKTKGDLNTLKVIETSALDISTCIYSLSHMQLQLDNMPASLRAAVFVGFKILSGFQDIEDKLKIDFKNNEKFLYGAMPNKRRLYSNQNDKLNKILNDIDSNTIIIREIEKFFNVSSADIKNNNIYENDRIAVQPSSTSDTDSLLDSKSLQYDLEGSNDFELDLPIKTLENLARVSSNMIYSLVQYNVTSMNDMLPTEIQEACYKCIDLYCEGSNLQSISMTLQSLGKMNVNWNEIKYSKVFSKLMTVLINLLKIEEVLIDQINNDNVHSFSKPVEKYEIDSKLHSVSNILYSFHLMKLHWNDLPVEFTSLLLRYTHKFSKSINRYISIKSLNNNDIYGDIKDKDSESNPSASSSPLVAVPSSNLLKFDTIINFFNSFYALQVDKTNLDLELQQSLYTLFLNIEVYERNKVISDTSRQYDYSESNESLYSKNIAVALRFFSNLDVADIVLSLNENWSNSTDNRTVINRYKINSNGNVFQRFDPINTLKTIIITAARSSSKQGLVLLWAAVSKLSNPSQFVITEDDQKSTSTHRAVYIDTVTDVVLQLMSVTVSSYSHLIDIEDISNLYLYLHKCIKSYPKLIIEHSNDIKGFQMHLLLRFNELIYIDVIDKPTNRFNQVGMKYALTSHKQMNSIDVTQFISGLSDFEDMRFDNLLRDHINDDSETLLHNSWCKLLIELINNMDSTSVEGFVSIIQSLQALGFSSYVKSLAYSNGYLFLSDLLMELESSIYSYINRSVDSMTPLEASDLVTRLFRMQFSLDFKSLEDNCDLSKSITSMDDLHTKLWLKITEGVADVKCKDKEAYNCFDHDISRNGIDNDDDDDCLNIVSSRVIDYRLQASDIPVSFDVESSRNGCEFTESTHDPVINNINNDKVSDFNGRKVVKQEKMIRQTLTGLRLLDTLLATNISYRDLPSTSQSRFLDRIGKQLSVSRRLFDRQCEVRSTNELLVLLNKLIKVEIPSYATLPQQLKAGIQRLVCVIIQSNDMTIYRNTLTSISINSTLTSSVTSEDAVSSTASNNDLNEVMFVNRCQCQRESNSTLAFEIMLKLSELRCYSDDMKAPLLRVNSQELRDIRDMVKFPVNMTISERLILASFHQLLSYFDVNYDDIDKSSKTYTWPVLRSSVSLTRVSIAYRALVHVWITFKVSINDLKAVGVLDMFMMISSSILALEFNANTAVASTGGNEYAKVIKQDVNIDIKERIKVADVKSMRRLHSCYNLFESHDKRNEDPWKLRKLTLQYDILLYLTKLGIQWDDIDGLLIHFNDINDISQSSSTVVSLREYISDIYTQHVSKYNMILKHSDINDKSSLSVIEDKFWDILISLVKFKAHTPKLSRLLREMISYLHESMKL